jgi:hypothetical protein
MAGKETAMKRESTGASLPDKSGDKLETALHEATHEQLCDVIRRKAEWGKGFRAEALMRLGVPDPREALNAR